MATHLSIRWPISKNSTRIDTVNKLFIFLPLSLSLSLSAVTYSYTSVLV